MFRTYQMLWNRIYQLLDIAIIAISFGVAWDIKFRSGLLPHGGHYSFTHYGPAMLAAIPIFLVSNWIVGLYNPMRSRSFWRITSAIFRSLIIGLLLFMSFLYFMHVSQFSRSVLGVFALCYTFMSYLKHMGVALLLRFMRSRGYNKKFVIIAGWTSAASRFLGNLDHHPWFGYHVIGYVNRSQVIDSVPYLGGLQELSAVIETNLVDYVLICLSRDEVSKMPEVVSACERLGVQSLIVPDYFDLLPASPRFEAFAGMPLIDTRYVPLDDAVNAVIKRVFDIIFSLLVLTVLSPVYAAIAVAVKLTSKGPIFFKQKRSGRNRRVFTMYKFRTMIHNASPAYSQDDTGWTVRDDLRRTKLGKFLRRTSLDELPQFWNVLKGDMSVIGPRPERPGYVDRFRKITPKYMVKHRVRPGITGWAQVHGWRGDTSIDKRIEYDVDYVENWSFSMDILIVLRTIRSGFRDENAY